MNLFLTILFFSVSIAYILFVWNHTNAFIEYYNLLKLKFLQSANKYTQQNSAGFIELYPEYLRKSENFFAKLFSCPICFGFWLSLFSVFFTGIFFILVAYLSLLLYFILTRLSTHEY
jgi:hypothetical protein